MRRPRMDAPVADEPPASDSLTPYDELHLIHYLRMLDAEKDEATWQDVTRAILSIDPDREPERARHANETHLARAKWMTRAGYRHLLASGPCESEA